MEYDSRYPELILGIFVVHMSSRELQAIYLQYSCFENTMIFESFLMLLMERWPSGLRRTLGKCVYPHRYRGYKTLNNQHITLERFSQS